MNEPALLAYQHVPLGFEVVIHNPDVEMGKAWNLWFNVTLSDDPARWDGEIRRLNALQADLGELTADPRLLRAQMAEFCRYHPPPHAGLDLLCGQIGTGRFEHLHKIGCEGRGLLDALGHHDAASVRAQRVALLAAYATVLKTWLGNGEPEDLLAARVFGFLGAPTAEKVRFVEWLVPALESGDASLVALRSLVEAACRASHGRSVYKVPGRPFNCFGCEACPADGSPPPCGCCYAMVVDAGLLCAGTRDEPRSMAEEFGRCVQETALAYALALNGWLTGAPLQPVSAFTEPRYVTEGLAAELAHRVPASLGGTDAVRAWLVACLLKTIKDNQRWHPRRELIDQVPQATSWFGVRDVDVDHAAG
jgi:hypothetical protein